METENSTPGAIPTTAGRRLGGRQKSKPDAADKPTDKPATGGADASTVPPSPPAGSKPDAAPVPDPAAAAGTIAAGATGAAAAVEQVGKAAVEAAKSTAALGFDLSALADCGLEFVVSEDVPLTDIKLKMLIYGDSGAGKTHFATNCEGVAVALVEPQGFATIKATGRRVLVPNFIPKDPTKAAKTPRLRNMDDLRAFVELARSGALANAGVRILVFDSLTEIQQLMINEIMAPARAEAKRKKAERAEQGKTAAPEMGKADWGTLGSMMLNFLTTIRDLPYTVVVLALTKPNEEEGTGIRRIYPNLSGSAQDRCPAYFNIVGLIYKVDQGGGKVKRLVLVDGDDRYYTKSYGPISGIVEADLGAWIAALEGDTAAKVKAEGARAPGAKRRQLGRGTTATTPPDTSADTKAAAADEEDDD